jgi:hypothetical protein
LRRLASVGGHRGKRPPRVAVTPARTGNPCARSEVLAPAHRRHDRQPGPPHPRRRDQSEQVTRPLMQTVNQVPNPSRMSRTLGVQHLLSLYIDTLDTPLNHRQIEVLNWIKDGCPVGRWTDVRFKTVAIALQSRRLVSISRRGGAWTATVLPAGVHYLTHDEYPAGHWRIRQRRTSPADHDVAAQPPPLPPREPKPPRRLVSRPRGVLTPTRKLLKDSWRRAL